MQTRPVSCQARQRQIRHKSESEAGLDDGKWEEDVLAHNKYQQAEGTRISLLGDKTVGVSKLN